MSLQEQAFQSQEMRESFVIDTKEKAVWALRKLAKIRREMEENQSIADKEIERIKLWLEDVNGALQKDAEYFESLLQAYHRMVLEENPKAKTIKLPHGTLKARKQEPDYIRDEEKLLAWTKENQPEAVKVKENVDWSTLKKMIVSTENGVAIDENGQVIEGITVVDRGIKFSVEVAE
ncbi:phage protein [Collibacillus ludicampi]|uniref:Phage protein n=1 Tax=Collibacillus ludicampi TaxID=2771369 RepID=A0AAV4LID9_9BACL|nr:host-nuclease inhibitor Gam family protein [Collibacillus ludicampi]GIM47590.1 phage protein [Collibacillus ludicampi]